jgi:hypothetical protein
MLRAVQKLPGVQGDLRIFNVRLPVMHASCGCRCAERACLLFCVGAAFSSSLTSAADSQDVAAAQNRVSARVFPMAGLLGRRMQPLQLLPGSSSISAVQRAALRRLQQRAQHAGLDAFDVLVNGDLQQCESMVCASLAAGMSLDLQPSTAQDQVCKVLLALALSL